MSEEAIGPSPSISDYFAIGRDRTLFTLKTAKIYFLIYQMNHIKHFLQSKDKVYLF